MDTIRHGVIGVKGIGDIHCRSALANPHVTLTALADIDATAVRHKAQEVSATGFTDHREMLDTGIVDAVSIAVPHHLHAPIALDCLRAGVHVFLEKPIAMRVSQADEIIDMAQNRELKLCVGHQYRTHRSSRILKDVIDRGTIGTILRVLWTWVEFRSERYYTRDVWRTSWELAGGGILINQVIHDLDLLCWLVGRPTKVNAMMANQLHEVEVEDLVSASIQFANGAMASVQGTINQPRGYSIRQIAGTNGTIVLPDVKSLTNDRCDRILLGTYEDPLPEAAAQLSTPHRQPETQWRDVSVPDRPFWKKVLQRLRLLQRERRPHGISVLFDSFIDAIQHGGEPLVTAESACQTLDLINGIFLSALREKTVELPVDRDEYDVLFDELASGATSVPRYR